MSLKLSDFPLDILLELGKQLDLPDSLHLAATCTTCAAVLLSPSFWIESLHRMEKIHRRPIPCSPGTDFAALPLDTLRNMAVHAYKLRKNWTFESGPLLATARSFTIRCEGYMLHIFPIEGTHMVVTVFHDGLACWSTTSGEFLGRRDLDSIKGGYWKSSSSLFILLGCALWDSHIMISEFIVFPDASQYLCYPSHGGQLILAVIGVNYRDPEAVTVSLNFSRSWPLPDRISIECVLVSENTVGVVGSTKDDAPCLFYCRTAQPKELCRLTLELQPTSPAAFAGVSIGLDFVIFRQDHGPSAEIIHMGPMHMHSTRHELTRVVVRPYENVALTCHIRPPTYGILNVAQRPTEGGTAHRVLFWPAEYSAARVSSDSDPSLTVGPLCWYEHPGSINRIAVGSSGTSVLVKDSDYTYLLLQYIPGTMPHVKSRRLKVPPMSQHPWTLVGLDDRLGVLYLAYMGLEPEKLGYQVKVLEFV
ncbi:hypothetical protein FB45DRAFT_953949 [Roridomyces roridus]|uniref:F-box domain-containing protein n=1 Tax=Roridomyces roridus TaxID=1738132 RepID=A0AAD7F9E5_9AGAR|nr:hypothetical protein FB45DRAFT_953949 [Roridomyces roridus]